MSLGLGRTAKNIASPELQYTYLPSKILVMFINEKEKKYGNKEIKLYF